MVFSTLSLFRGLAANECKIRIAPNSSSDSISLQIMRALKSLGDFRSLSFEDADGYEVDGIQLVGALAQVSCRNAPAEAPAAAAAGTVECPFQYLSALVGRECWADGSCSTILKVRVQSYFVWCLFLASPHINWYWRTCKFKFK